MWIKDREGTTERSAIGADIVPQMEGPGRRAAAEHREGESFVVTQVCLISSSFDLCRRGVCVRPVCGCACWDVEVSRHDPQSSPCFLTQDSSLNQDLTLARLTDQQALGILPLLSQCWSIL